MPGPSSFCETIHGQSYTRIQDSLPPFLLALFIKLTQKILNFKKESLYKHLLRYFTKQVWVSRTMKHCRSQSWNKQTLHFLNNKKSEENVAGIKQQKLNPIFKQYRAATEISRYFFMSLTRPNSPWRADNVFTMLSRHSRKHSIITSNQKMIVSCNKYAEKKNKNSLLYIAVHIKGWNAGPLIILCTFRSCLQLVCLFQLCFNVPLDAWFLLFGWFKLKRFWKEGKIDVTVVGWNKQTADEQQLISELQRTFLMSFQLIQTQEVYYIRYFPSEIFLSTKYSQHRQAHSSRMWNSSCICMIGTFCIFCPKISTETSDDLG